MKKELKEHLKQHLRQKLNERYQDENNPEVMEPEMSPIPRKPYAWNPWPTGVIRHPNPPYYPTHGFDWYYWYDWIRDNVGGGTWPYTNPYWNPIFGPGQTPIDIGDVPFNSPNNVSVDR